MKLVMDLVVNHTSDEHPWFVESPLRPATTPKRDWYWWRPARRGMAAGAPGAEPNNWASFFSGPAWQLDEAQRRVLPAPVLAASSPTSTGRTREVREAVYAMMRWWLDRGVDGFRMDVINMISKDVAPARRAPAARAASRRRLAVLPGRPADPRVPAGDAPRGLRRARRRSCSPSARCPASPSRRRGCSPTRPAARSTWSSSSSTSASTTAASKWDVSPAASCATSRRSLGRWQAGLADVGWNSLYWNNHDQPRAVSRFGDDGRVWRVRSAKALATVLHLHRGTPYVYQGEELGMTNVPFDGHRATSATSSRSTTTPTAVGRGQRPRGRARRRCAR